MQPAFSAKQLFLFALLENWKAAAATAAEPWDVD